MVNRRDRPWAAARSRIPGAEVQPPEKLAEAQSILDEPRIRLPDEIGLGLIGDQAGRHTILPGHETVAIGRPRMHGMTLTSFLELATSEPFSEHGPLILGDRSLNLQQELIVGIIGNRMKEEGNLAPSPPEPFEQKHLIGIFSSQTVRAVHCDKVDLGIPNRIAETIEGGPIETGSAVSFVAEDVGFG